MKPLIFLGAILAFGATALAFMTRAKLIEARSEKDMLNRGTVKLHDEARKVNDVTTGIFNQYSESKKSADEEVTAAETAKKEAAAKDAELEAANNTVKEIIDKRERMNAEIKAILGGIGTPEEVLAKVESAKNEIDARTKEMDTLSKEVEIARKDLNAAEQTTSRLREAQSLRTKAVSLGGKSGTVAAVNPEWAFCVINMGQSQGVTMDSRLIVKRGTQLIGKLNIVQINANQTIADIDKKGFGNGQQVLPGDEVIFDNSAS